MLHSDLYPFIWKHFYNNITNKFSFTKENSPTLETYLLRYHKVNLKIIRKIFPPLVPFLKNIYHTLPFQTNRFLVENRRASFA